MAFPDTLADKKSVSYTVIANAVASEDPSTPTHAQRLSIAKQMATLSPSFDQYVFVDFQAQGYTGSTSQATIDGRLSGLLTNLVALGFGG